MNEGYGRKQYIMVKRAEIGKILYADKICRELNELVVCCSF